jgi:hypothetical protein
VLTCMVGPYGVADSRAPTRGRPTPQAGDSGWHRTGSAGLLSSGAQVMVLSVWLQDASTNTSYCCSFVRIAWHAGIALTFLPKAADACELKLAPCAIMTVQGRAA